MGAALFGFSKLYGEVAGGQAEYLRVPQAQFTHVKVPDGLPDERFVYLSDVLPTAWQSVEYAGVSDGGTLVVLGLGPIGDMACRIALHKGYRVIGVDLVPERLERVKARGAEVVDLRDHEKDLGDAIREMTNGRGPDSVVDAVGMEAHGASGAAGARLLQKAVGLLPDAVAQKATETAGVDSLTAMHTAFDAVRRGGTVSLSGVYTGSADPTDFMSLFDKQVTIRMGQCNVQRWRDELLPIVEDPADPLGTMDLTTHEVPLDRAPEMYKTFRDKTDGCIKVVMKPN
jgi:hypothetical protein